jgi:hypothetical protein
VVVLEVGDEFVEDKAFLVGYQGERVSVVGVHSGEGPSSLEWVLHR